MANYYIVSTKYSTQERQTKRGKVYDIVFRIITKDGIEKQKKLSGFKTKTLAKEAYTLFVTDNCELVKGYTVKKKNISKNIITIEDAIKEYLRSLPNSNKESTIYDKTIIFENFVIPQIGKLDIKNINKTDLYTWQENLWKSINPRTKTFYSYKYLSTIRGHLSALFNWFCEKYDIPNVFNQIKKPKRNSSKKQVLIFWTRETFDTFIDTIDKELSIKPDNAVLKRFRMMCLLLFFTGRRKGEIYALTPSDIKETSIIFNKSLTRKTLDDSSYKITTTKADKEQEIPICTRLQNEIKNYTFETPFAFGGEQPIHDNTFTRMFKRYIVLSDVPEIRVHDLRHSFVSMLIHLGANYNVIADLISDTVEQVIKTYGHLYQEDKLSVIAKIN